MFILRAQASNVPAPGRAALSGTLSQMLRAGDIKRSRGEETMTAIEPQYVPVIRTVQIIGHCPDGRLAAFMEEMEETAARYKDIEIKTIL